MSSDIKESGMNAVISILEGDDDYSPEDLNTILEFCMRLGQGGIDEDLKELLGQSVNRMCYRNDQYAFPLISKATLLKLPEVQVHDSTSALIDQSAVKKMYIINLVLMVNL